MIKYLTVMLIFVFVTGCTNQNVSDTQLEPQAVAQTTVETPTATPSPLPGNTPTPVPPTVTPTVTNTSAPPTATPTQTVTPATTPTPTETPIPPTETPIPTDTPIPPIPTKSAADHLAQAETYYQAENWEEVINELQIALQMQPDLGEAYKLLGFSYSRQNDFEPGIQLLEQYLQLMPEAEDKATIETEIQNLKDQLATKQYGVDIPPGKALFVFLNHTGDQWNVDVGPYFLEVPPKPVDQDTFFVTQVIDPGSYSWTAASAGGGKRAEDNAGNRAFDFTVAVGEVKVACVGGGSSDVSASKTRNILWNGAPGAIDDLSYTSVSVCSN